MLTIENQLLQIVQMAKYIKYLKGKNSKKQNLNKVKRFVLPGMCLRSTLEVLNNNRARRQAMHMPVKVMKL